MRRPAAVALTIAALALAGCAAPAPSTPLLRLPPAALGTTLALQQQIVVQTASRTQRVDVLLEADAASVRIAVIALGHTVARLTWDGERLDETRAAGWPDAVSAARVLSDLQLAWWPAPAIAAALPAGWTLQVDGDERRLQRGAEPVATVRQTAPGRIELEHRLDGYRLVVDSRPLPEDPS